MLGVVLHRWQRALVAGITLCCLGVSFAAQSQGVFEQLVSPGPLSNPHAKYEKECTSCHEPFVRQSQSGLCLACHKPIDADRTSGRGFHGKNPEAKSGNCRTCHAEHKGRAADIVQLNRQLLNHAQTNYPLEGGHKRVACIACHKGNDKFRAAPSGCVACHKGSDPHRGNLGEACASCHSVEGWQRVKPFDHSKTKFPLLAAHARARCEACHVGERYKGLARACVACHANEDKHAGRNGEKCETCHTVQTWKKAAFNHDKATRFALRGEHGKVRCEGCHGREQQIAKPAKACVGCHETQDPHKGELGKTCEKCHQEAGWRKKIAFDHELTRFPLIGLHAPVPCEDCHRSASYKGTATACASCHKDTHHEGRLGPLCATCHTPNGWKLWRFDHDRQTRFVLTGAHKALDCHACHKDKLGRASAPTTCVACHRQDDSHQGAFGAACDKCHSTSSFREGTRAR